MSDRYTVIAAHNEERTRLRSVFHSIQTSYVHVRSTCAPKTDALILGFRNGPGANIEMGHALLRHGASPLIAPLEYERGAALSPVQ